LRATVDHLVKPEHPAIEHPMMKPEADNVIATATRSCLPLRVIRAKASAGRQRREGWLRKKGWSTLPFTGSEVPLIAFAGAAAIAAGALLRRRTDGTMHRS
jgi:hypothetical protein